MKENLVSQKRSTCWVAAHAGALGTDLEDAETGKFDGLAVLQRLGDEVQRALDQLGAILTRQADLIVDGFAEIRPGHCFVLHPKPPARLS